MKSYLLLPIASLFFFSCTTAYQSGQTPDDVYYSPARPVDEYVHMERRDDRQYRYNRYDEYDMRQERLTRMRLRNRMFETVDDEWYMWDMYHRTRNSFANYYSPLGYWYAWNVNYNPYFVNGCPTTAYYNPYGTGFLPGTVRNEINRPRTYNLAVFDREMNNLNPNLPKGYGTSSPRYRDNSESYRGTGNTAGDHLRNIFGGSGSEGYKTGSSNSGNSSSGSSSSGSSSSGDNGSRGRATRGGN